jgi:hypothetical protein
MHSIEDYRMSARAQAEWTGGSLVTWWAQELQGKVEKMDHENDPGLEMGQRMWQKVKGGEGG